MLANVWCLAVLVVVPPSVSAVADNETERLQAKVKQLEAEIKSLQAEVARLKAQLAVGKALKDDPQLAADARRLTQLHQALKKDPKNKEVRQQAVALAKKLALARAPYPIVWTVLLSNGLLKDGMSLADAEKLIGPRTEETKTSVGWYFNPNHRLHVAPYLTAKKTQDGLSGWMLTSR
jgi:hypothetical protein